MKAMNQDYVNEPEDFDYEEGEEIEIEAIGIEVSSHPIELYKLFKVANLVGGGGEAKHFIAEGYVAVNGELETRKRRKMYDGDFFEFNQEYYVVVCDQPPMEPEETKASTQVASSDKAKKEKSRNNSSSVGKKQNKANNAASKKSNKNGSSKEQSKKAPSKKSGNKDPNSGRGSIDFF